jgi:hypothetical protein
MRMCTYSPDVATDHQAHVLGEGVHQVGKGRAGRGVPGHHQTLGPTGWWWLMLRWLVFS